MCGHKKTHTKTKPHWLGLINKVIKLNKPQKNISQSTSCVNKIEKTYDLASQLKIKNQLSCTNAGACFKNVFSRCSKFILSFGLVNSIVVLVAPKSCRHKHMHGQCAYAVWSVVGSRRPNQKCLLQATQ